MQLWVIASQRKPYDQLHRFAIFHKAFAGDRCIGVVLILKNIIRLLYDLSEPPPVPFPKGGPPPLYDVLLLVVGQNDDTGTNIRRNTAVFHKVYPGDLLHGSSPILYRYFYCTMLSRKFNHFRWIRAAF